MLSRVRTAVTANSDVIWKMTSLFRRLVAKTCSHRRPDSTKLVSRQYIEKYWKLSKTTENCRQLCSHRRRRPDKTVLSGRSGWCEMGLRAKFTLTCRILSRSVYSVAFGRRKSQILPIFGFRHFLMSPTRGVWRKSNAVAQLQNFPYTTVSKPFTLMGKWFLYSLGNRTHWAETPLLKSVTDTQTDKQKTQRFWPLRRRWSRSPTKFGMLLDP